MIRKHTGQSVMGARTVYELTEDEVLEALARFIVSQGEPVPEGDRFIWLRSDYDRDSHRFIAFVVDHVATDEAKP